MTEWRVSVVHLDMAESSTVALKMTWLHPQHYPDGCRQLTDPTLGTITLHILSATSATSLKDQEFNFFTWQLCPVIPVFPLCYPFMCLEKSPQYIKKLQHQVLSSALQHWPSVSCTSNLHQYVDPIACSFEFKPKAIMVRNKILDSPRT